MTYENPADIAAERSLLGQIIMDDRLIREAEELTVEDFYSLKHRVIFQTMLRMGEDQESIDYVTVCGALGAKLDEAGGREYIVGLTDGLVARDSLKTYIRILREKRQHRDGLQLAEVTAARFASAIEKPATILGDLETHTLRLALDCEQAYSKMFVDVTEFCNRQTSEINWLVDGLIEKGSNGFICADPKGAKSLTAAALAVSLALGEPWVDFRIPRRVKAAVVSREDNPDTTQRRITRIVQGKGAYMEELKGWLYINSKRETPRFSLDNPAEFKALIADLKRIEAEFVILDVFNKLHSQDENDNSKMRIVLDKIDRIYAETGAQVCTLHHWNKSAEASVTRRMRGAGAIAGAAEWITGIEMVDEPTETRCMQFEIKGGGRIPPIYYRILDNPDKTEIRLEKCDKPVEEVKPRKAKAASAGLFAGGGNA